MSSRKALAFSFLDRYAGLALAIVSSMVVARLLTPAEIGVFSIAMVLLSYIGTMRDFGAGQYLIQEKELTTERVRATWTVQLGLGIGFAFVVLIAAVPVSHLYGEPRLRDLMFVLALNFAVSPFGSLTYAWLMREMRFDSLALMRLAGSLTGALVSVGMAWRGHGAISLAAGSLASTTANAVIATFFRPATFPWRPGLTDIRRVLSFGGRMSATNVFTTVGNSVPDLVLGKLHGMAELGQFSRANGLAAMFHRLILDATHSVAMPLFSQASRDGNGLGPLFVKATAYVTAVGWSFFGVMVVLAGSIVRVLYGDQWDAAIVLTRLVAGGMAIGLPTAFCATTLMATGSMNSLVRATLINVLQTAGCAAIGASMGAVALGWAGVLSGMISIVVWMWLTPLMRQLNKGQFATPLLQGFGVAAFTVAAASVGLLWPVSGTASHVLRLAIGIGAAAPTFVAAVWLLNHPLREELQRVWLALRRRRTVSSI